MKKNGFRGIIGMAAILTAALVFGLLLGGCATSMIYDKKVPMKEQCVIVNAELITHIDGKTVDFGEASSTSVVYPAGGHTIRIKLETRYIISSETSRSGNTQYTHTTYIPYTLDSYITAPFEFKPGKRYVLKNIHPALQYKGGLLTTSDKNVSISTRGRDVFVDNPGLEIVEAGTMPFSTHIGLEFMPSMFMGWSYKDLILIGGGPRLGLSILHGYLDIKLLSEAGAGGMLSVPDLSDFGLGGSVYYGGVVDITFPKIGLELGGGMIHGFQWSLINDDKGIPGFSTPYLQAGIFFPDDGNWGIYGQYYLNGEQWYNTFGAGIKFSW
jgi:hypothetical protein